MLKKQPSKDSFVIKIIRPTNLHCCPSQSCA